MTLSAAFAAAWHAKLAPAVEGECLASLYEQYAAVHESIAERLELIEAAVENSHTQSSRSVKDPTSVLELRDWLCARVAQSRRKKPLSATEIRSFMEYLRAAPPEERAAVALRLACVHASDLPQVQDSVDAELLQRWLIAAPAGMPRDATLLRSLGALAAASASSAKSSKQDLCMHAQLLRTSQLDALRYVHSRVTLPREDFWARYPLDFRGELSAWSGALVHESSLPVPAVLPAAPEASLEAPCAANELALIMEDGTVLLPQKKAIASPRVCKELGAVIAADAVPLSSCIVAIVLGSAGRKLVMWHAFDTASYATAHTFAGDACDDSVDVQLTEDGDMLVQTAQRGSHGAAQGVISTFCFRMTGTDLSTLQHVDAARCEDVLWRRRFGGEINHMNHGNVLMLQNTVSTAHGTESAEVGGAEISITSRVHYAHVRLDLAGLAALAVWGNPHAAYVWTRAGMQRVAWKGQEVTRAACAIECVTMMMQ
jgi:hypothetical protein